MYKMIPWTKDLDLSEFYRIADSKGFANNNSQKTMIDCFDREPEKCVWILYSDDVAVGSVAAHTFDIMGENCYRICARTCVFTDMLPGTYGRGLRTSRVITELQNPTAQFFIPTCIEWAPKGSRLFITSTDSDLGTQRLVHRIFGPLMSSRGMMQRISDVVYRNTNQTVWELFPDVFMRELNKYPRWT
jgi:hypothetical protein